MINLEIKAADKFTNLCVYAHSKYDPNLVNIYRSMSVKYYHVNTKEWEFPIFELDELLNKLNGYKYTLIGEELLNKVTSVIPRQFKFKTKPFKHQSDAIEFGLKHNKWLLGDTMGLGKTKVAIDLACIKKQSENYKHCLIICGINGLKWNWLNEIKVHSNEGAYILGQRIKNNLIKIDSNKDKLADVEHLGSIREYFIITNIETLREQKIVSELKKSILNDEIGMIVLDEAHVCKNPSSQQSKGLLKLKADTMLAMTGTPLMNSPIDLYIILKWLGYETHSFYQFKNYYCIMGGYGGYEIIGYKHLNELQDQLNSIMVRRLKEDVFDLPEKIYINEYVELLPKQRQIYQEVTQEIRANIDKIQLLPNPLVELIRMRQVTGYPGILSSTITESAKLDRLEELVDEAVKNNQKVVIFSNWTQMTDAIKNRLRTKQLGLRVITGETSDSVRQSYVDDFQSNENCKVILGTIGAMGTGITLTAGTVEIFVDEPWNKALKEQAVDRCHRIGTKSNVTIYTLIAKNTIDERINDIVENKGLLADQIVDGKLVGNKKEILEFLIN